MAKKSTNKKYTYVTKTLTLPDGSRKYVYGKTKAEAEEKLAELRAQIAGGVDINDDTRFGELAKTWIDKYKAPYVKPSSLNTIKSMLNAKVMPHWAAIPVKSITSLMVQNLFADLVSSGYGSTSSVLTYVRDIFGLAVDLGCISKSPVMSTLKVPSRPQKKEKEVLPLAVEECLLSTFRPLTPERLFFLLGRLTGMRRGEILALNWDCINLQTRIITIRRGLVLVEKGKTKIVPYTKTEQGLRSVPIPQMLYDELKFWHDWFGTNKNPRSGQSGGFLFTMKDGKPYTGTAWNVLWRKFRKAVEMVGPDYAENFTSHVLRHTYITRLFEAGLDIKEIQVLAGHKDVATTLGTYTHYDRATRQDTTFALVRDFLEGKMETVGAEVIAFPNVVKLDAVSEG